MEGGRVDSTTRLIGLETCRDHLLSHCTRRNPLRGIGNQCKISILKLRRTPDGTTVGHDCCFLFMHGHAPPRAFVAGVVPIQWGTKAAKSYHGLSGLPYPPACAGAGQSAN